MSCIEYTNGVVCQCFCCKYVGTDCLWNFAANTTVQSCLSCNPLLCQSTYNSSCVLINGRINSTCIENGTSGGNSSFLSLYSTFIIAIVSFLMLINQKIKY